MMTLEGLKHVGVYIVLIKWWFNNLCVHSSMGVWYT